MFTAQAADAASDSFTKPEQRKAPLGHRSTVTAKTCRRKASLKSRTTSSAVAAGWSFDTYSVRGTSSTLRVHGGMPFASQMAGPFAFAVGEGDRSDAHDAVDDATERRGVGASSAVKGVHLSHPSDGTGRMGRGAGGSALRMSGTGTW